MRTTAIMIMIGICDAMVAAQMLPGDGERVTVYSLDAEVTDSPTALCDLSGAEVTGETEMRFEYYGDSLVRRVAGSQADWLRISGDTVMSLGSDTRRDNTRFSRGLPYLLPRVSAETGDSVRHNVFLTLDRENLIACRYSSRRGGGFILPGGDTIAATYCVETVVSDSAASVCRRQWYAEGCVWPVVEQVTARTGGEEQSAVNICLPDDQPRPKAAARSVSGRAPSGGGVYAMLAQLHCSDPAPSWPGNPAADNQFAVNVIPDGITITGEDTDGATVRLFDASGRQWHDGPAAATIPTSQLPSGVYLLNITTATTSRTTKLTLR